MLRHLKTIEDVHPVHGVKPYNLDGVCFSPDGRWLGYYASYEQKSGGLDFTFSKCFNLYEGAVQTTYNLGLKLNAPAFQVFTSDSRHLAVATCGVRLHLEVKPGNYHFPPSEFAGGAASFALAISPDGRWNAHARGEGWQDGLIGNKFQQRSRGTVTTMLRLDEANDGRRRGLFNKAPKPVIVAQKGLGYETLAFSADSRYLALGSRKPEISIWDIEAQRMIHTIDLPDEKPGEIPLVAYSPDGEYFVYGRRQLRLRCLRTREEYRLDSPFGATRNINGVEFEVTPTIPPIFGCKTYAFQFTPNSRYLIGASYHGVYFWNIAASSQTYREFGALDYSAGDGPTEIPGFESIAIAPNSEIIVTAGWSEINLWKFVPSPDTLPP
ncbi:MAG: WD40 repeat domain-containing protein [Anaerolineae bacterium]|nr:WD40 repeat domain-containing protein [Anaerolineae bacterium]